MQRAVHTILARVVYRVDKTPSSNSDGDSDSGGRLDQSRGASVRVHTAAAADR